MIQAFYMDRCHFCPSPESSKVICRSIQRKVKDFFSFFTCSMSDLRSKENCKKPCQPQIQRSEQSLLAQPQQSTTVTDAAKWQHSTQDRLNFGVWFEKDRLQSQGFRNPQKP